MDGEAEETERFPRELICSRGKVFLLVDVGGVRR
ncbi:hypothetical protein MycrhN_6154 [Mycolicibacterium rhodesiae NBB3]|jgi:hypothetical protein|uniref:Uncharacterized protein n=1 Tax=Mycolicibacterium rhodesiae (strain NBB3) TaxID=710685 RepID=G8RTQ1_MYCRN|nr:hypothetical protein MycrhN_6154 [Mycolicibacterium rhodesiae NBB3]